MKTLLLFSLIFLISCVSAYARYGETLEELEKRFGKGSKQSYLYLKPPAEVVYNFKMNNIYVSAYMVDGKCDKIVYSSTGGKEFTEDEILNFLALNGQGHSWIRTDKPKRFDNKTTDIPNRSWYRDCMKVVAYNYHNRDITIISLDYIQKEMDSEKKAKEAKEAKEKMKTDGF